VEPVELAQVNWIMIMIVTLSGLVFLLLLVPTIRYARSYFCPEVMNNEVSPDIVDLEQTNDQVNAKQAVRYGLISRPVEHDPNTLCCICLDTEANCILRPCSHDSYCENCVAYICRSSNQCPVCRSFIEQVDFFKTDQVPSCSTPTFWRLAIADHQG